MQLAGHAAILDRPRGARALLVLAHGAGAGMRHPFMAELVAELAARRIATVRWEFRYLTEGKRRTPRAEDAEAEVRAVWTAAAKLTKLPRFAGGKSFGGRMTSRAHAASPLAGARGLVFAGFPLHPAGKPGVERAAHLASAPGPMLFVQGTRDELAELALLRPVVAALGTRATLHVIEGADHGFTRAGNVAAAAAAIADWIALHL
ncbi:MAG TPA: alpha/beta family hydrolase [Kofleriaceae bacterium]|nr:alpha/beta family hydrolase [Kofleriaceae bacterium]